MQVPLESMNDKKFKLDAVEYDNAYTTHWDNEASALRFRLDGISYAAVENPDDGYRSSLDALIIEPGDPKYINTFKPVEVVCKYISKSDRGYRSSSDCDILKILSVETGECVIEVGTDNTDDYYPSFVGDFNPKNLGTYEVILPEEPPEKKPRKGEDWYDDTLF